jgi:glycosyltransferase involved in cell wall biosynthesis
MSVPKITVLMPVYNAGRFLRAAIESILSQTFRDFEFLIIDDGSTDQSVSIIQSYDDDRITFHQNKSNLGISETLNIGIEIASCELIARMDADDISHPQRLEKQYHYMVANPDCALLSTWCNVVDENGKLVRLERYRSNFYYYNITFECWMYHPTIMFKKTPVQAVGSYSMRYSEDYDLFWKVSRKFKIWNLTEALLEYRLSPTSLNTVAKKTEYDIANEQNVVRNLKYFMGPDFEVPKVVLECLRHNFQPMINEGNQALVLQTIATLNAITDKIIRRSNPNRDVRSIRRAHYFKQKFILTELARAWPLAQGLPLLIRTNAWTALYQLSIHSAGWRLKNHLKRALSFFI